MTGHVSLDKRMYRTDENYAVAAGVSHLIARNFNSFGGIPAFVVAEIGVNAPARSGAANP